MMPPEMLLLHAEAATRSAGRPLTMQGPWTPGRVYDVNDCVFTEAGLWVAHGSTVEEPPAAPWELIAAERDVDDG